MRSKALVLILGLTLCAGASWAQAADPAPADEGASQSTQGQATQNPMHQEGDASSQSLLQSQEKSEQPPAVAPPAESADAVPSEPST